MANGLQDLKGSKEGEDLIQIGQTIQNSRGSIRENKVTLFNRDRGTDKSNCSEDLISGLEVELGQRRSKIVWCQSM